MEFQSETASQPPRLEVDTNPLQELEWAKLSHCVAFRYARTSQEMLSASEAMLFFLISRLPIGLPPLGCAKSLLHSALSCRYIYICIYIYRSQIRFDQAAILRRGLVVVWIHPFV